MFSSASLVSLLSLTQVLALPSITTIPTYTSDESSLISRSSSTTLTVLVCADSTNKACSKTPAFPVKRCQSVSDKSGGYPNLQWNVGYYCNVYEEKNCKGKSVKKVESPGINVWNDATAISKGITQVGSFKCYQDKSSSKRDATEI